MKVKDLFSEIDEQPIGCASLARVHRAVLVSGEEVAVKIQYPFIRKFTWLTFEIAKYFGGLECYS